MLPGKQALKREVVTLVTLLACRIMVPCSPAATHTNKEWCHHSQRVQREAAHRSTCLATFRDDLYSARPSQAGTHVLVLLLGSQSRN